ncbi:hypothetical protein V1506DRAFT_575020 [Lipomyces tetrasporus]
MTDVQRPEGSENSGSTVQQGQGNEGQYSAPATLFDKPPSNSGGEKLTTGRPVVNHFTAIGPNDHVERPTYSSAPAALLYCRRRRRRRPVGPLPSGQKNALLNDVEDNLEANHCTLLLFLSWIAVLLQTALSAAATAVAGSSSNQAAIVTLTASATVSGAVVALFKNSAEPQISQQRKLELDHLKLRVEAVDTNITANDNAALAKVLATLSCLRQAYENIDRQTSSGYIGVMSSSLRTSANGMIVPTSG